MCLGDVGYEYKLYVSYISTEQDAGNGPELNVAKQEYNKGLGGKTFVSVLKNSLCSFL